MELEKGKQYTEIDLTALGFQKIREPSTTGYPVYHNGHERYVMKSNGNGRMTVYICWNYSHARRFRSE